MKKKTVVDLFCGAGGLSKGFLDAGYDVVLGVDYDESALKTFQENHGTATAMKLDLYNHDNITCIVDFLKEKGIHTLDVLVGGPPCQGYSQKGQRKTINDDRNFLFRYFVEVVREVQPLYFVMENVPNLLTAENGYFKNEITTLFKDMGYIVNADVLCAANYGVPQNRNRAFIIGKKGGQVPVDMPIKENAITTIWDAISDLNYLDSGEGANEQEYLNEPMSEYQKRMRAGSTKLFGHVATNHSEVALNRMRMIPPKGGKECLPPEQLTKSIYSGTWERMDADDVSVTITTRFDTPASGKFMHPYLDRAITVREAARIQSFPDTFHFYGTKTSQMKQVGNAVPPLLAQAVARAIVKDMEKEMECHE